MITPITSTLVHKIVEPGTVNPGPHPTVILLHGRGTDENDLLGLASYLDPRLLIIGVRAPFPFAYGGNTWYEIIQIGAPEGNQFQESYKRLHQFILDARAGYPIDPERLFLLGFSMGSVMSFAVALSQPQLVRGIIAHSGYVPEHSLIPFQWEKISSVSFFIGHGTYDPVIPINFGRRAKELLSIPGVDLTYKEYPLPHTMSEESLADITLWLRHRL